MWIPLLICYTLAGATSLAFLRFHIKLFRYPLYYSIPVMAAVAMPLSITILLPTDYVSHNAGSAIPGFDISDSSMLRMWKTNYWITFSLTWLILPLLQDFYRAGDRLKTKKLISSLKSNLKFQGLILLVAVAGAIYLMLEVGLTLGHLKSMVIALSHIYALVLALWLMAHGLITIPRNRWLEGNLTQNLNHYYLKVPKLVDTLEDTKMSFKENVIQVLVLEKTFSDPTSDIVFRDWILSLAQKVPDDIRESVTREFVNNETRHISRDQVSEAFLTQLAYNFQNHQYKLSAHMAEYDTLLREITKLQTLLEAKAASTPDERNQIMRSVSGLLSPAMSFYFQCYIKPVLCRLLSVALLCVSFILIQSEFFHSTKLSLMDIVIYRTGIHNHTLTQGLVSFLVFSYMLFCALNSLAKLKVFNMYHLVPHHSDPVSTCFYASYIARLTIPLSYNFITLFTSRQSIFEEWYGKSIHLTGLFNLMNNWIPRLLLIPIVLTTFHVYDKLKSRIGLNSDFYDSWANFDDDENMNEATDLENAQNKRKELVIVEAKRLVAMEMNKRQSTASMSLRPFNLNTAADSAYESNRRAFNESLSGGLSNRVDSYHDDDDPVEENSGFWGRVGGAVNGLRDVVQTKFTRGTPSYTDTPLDSYDYDEDNLII
ncbi:LMBR1-like membrane family protein [Clavispora lusitaniae]|uniref:LMBR1-like membrane family protein n=1 Tax=Clavispora lusitaniae TaxID=36911 RepID=UPI00202C5EED|nr:LMBR1-like membrane family protein [Clavispora lusitaniae]